jgi:hypothetical protein
MRRIGPLTRSALVAVLFASPALGRAEAESAYTKAQIYHGALRYLRVDLDYEVTERDPDAAYLLFRYIPPGRKNAENGAIEIVETPKSVRLFVQLPKLPGYHEQVLKDGLLKKLGSEYGAPPERKKAEKPKGKDSPEESRDSDEDRTESTH